MNEGATKLFLYGVNAILGLAFILCSFAKRNTTFDRVLFAWQPYWPTIVIAGLVTLTVCLLFSTLFNYHKRAKKQKS